MTKKGGTSQEGWLFRACMQIFQVKNNGYIYYIAIKCIVKDIGITKPRICQMAALEFAENRTSRQEYVSVFCD